MFEVSIVLRKQTVKIFFEYYGYIYIYIGYTTVQPIYSYISYMEVPLSYNRLSNLKKTYYTCSNFLGTISLISYEIRYSHVIQLQRKNRNEDFLIDIQYAWSQLQRIINLKEYHLKQNKHQWQQFKTDLKKLSKWLKKAEGMVPMTSHVPDSVHELEALIATQQVSMKCLQDFFVILNLSKSQGYY